MSDEATYGQRVRAARKEQGLSQKGFAESIGVSSQYLCDIEFGRRTPAMGVAGRIWFGLGVRLESPSAALLRAALVEAMGAFDPAWPGACPQECFDASDGHGYERQERARELVRRALGER